MQRAGDLRVGGCMKESNFYFSPLYMNVNLHSGRYKEALVNVPHVTHECLRPRMYSDDISFELNKYPAVGLNVEEDVNCIQMWYDDKMIGVNEQLYENDQLMMEMSDTSICLDKISVDPSKGVMKFSKFGKL